MADLHYVAGLEELRAALKQLPERISRNVLRGAVAAGAAVIRKEAQAIAPVYTGSVAQGHPPPGTLKRSIVQKQIVELSGPTRQTFYVTVRKGKKYRGQGKKGNLSQDAYYASWVEFGHYYVPPRPKGVSRKAHRAANRAKFVPAKPFMRPAFESKKGEAVAAIREYMANRIPQEVAKLAGKK